MDDGEFEVRFLDDPPEGWLSASAARGIIAAVVGNHTRAERAIFTRLRAGLIRARCARDDWEEDGIYLKGPGWDPFDYLTPIGRHGTYVGADVVDEWNWEIGDFSWDYYGASGGLATVHAFGVEFSADDILRMRDCAARGDLNAGSEEDEAHAADAPVITSKSIPFSDRNASEQWYRARIQEAVEQGCRYNRDDDEAAGRALGLKRPRIRELRDKFAPDDWHRRTKKAGQ